MAIVTIDATALAGPHVLVEDYALAISEFSQYDAHEFGTLDPYTTTIRQ